MFLISRGSGRRGLELCFDGCKLRETFTDTGSDGCRLRDYVKRIFSGIN